MVSMYVLQHNAFPISNTVSIYVLQDIQSPMFSIPVYSVVDNSKKKNKTSGSHTTASAVMQ